MSLKLHGILVILLMPALTSAQATEQHIQTEGEFVSVLCNESAESRRKLLTSHYHLVNDRLWRTLIQRAAAAFYGSSPQQSLATYEIATQVATQLNSPKLLAITSYYIGRTYSGLNHFTKAVESYEKSRVIFEQAGLHGDLIYILADLGRLHFILEDFQKASGYSEQSLALVDGLQTGISTGIWPPEYGKATALATLADLNLRNGEYDQAVEKLKTSVALYRRLNGAGSYYDTYIAGDLQTLGRVYTASGNYTEGLIYLNQSLKITKTLSDPNRMASLLNSIGVLYVEQEDYPQAKKHFDESLGIYLSGMNQKEAARVLLNLGVVEQRQSHYDEALLHFKRSLEAAKVSEIVDVEIAAGEGIGVVLTAKKDFASALDNLNRSLEIAKAINDKTRQIELLWRIAETSYDMGNYARAVVHAESALALAHALKLPKLSYLASTTLGQTYSAQNKLELATNTLKQAVEQLEAMRDQVGGAEVKSQVFLENKVASYHSLVDLHVKQDKPLDALLFAERAKGRVLLDVLSGGRPEISKVMTTGEKQEGQRLNRKISEISDHVKSQQIADSSALNSLYRQLDAARLEYQSFQDALYVAHPNLKVRSGRTASLTEADLNRLTLKSDAAYLEYVTSKGRVYLFVLSTKSAGGSLDLKVYPIAIKPNDLAGKVNQFHQKLANRHPDFANIARELYATLIEPAGEQLRGITTICIVPDGFLWNLPFQALMTGSNHYLIEDYALYYAPSLSVLREMTKERVGKEKRAASLIAFGNPVVGRDEQRNEELCPLPEAETEVASVAETIGSAGSKVFIGREASERAFRALAPAYATIHLATHGVLDNRHPLYSHLLLTKTNSDTEDDGLLEAREILNMKLNAELAVLSACETANGRIAPGEGVMGMSWAFFVAGTRSMLVSQWKVNSASTSQFMANFYQALKSNQSHIGGNKAQSVQGAARRLMQDRRYRHPFYWAGFVLVGSNQ